MQSDGTTVIKQGQYFALFDDQILLGGGGGGGAHWMHKWMIF